jgi:polyhydroxyalkanoate synthesis regulator phasin
VLGNTHHRNFTGLSEYPKVTAVTKEYEKERTNMKRLLLGIGVFGLALGIGIMGISYASEAPQVRENFFEKKVSNDKADKKNLLEDVLSDLVEEGTLSQNQSDSVLSAVESKKLTIKAEREEIKNLINEMLEDGKITIVELDSVAIIDQEKIDRFKERFSEELEDGVISEEEFKDNIKSHHRKGHHKSKGSK